MHEDEIFTKWLYSNWKTLFCFVMLDFKYLWSIQILDRLDEIPLKFVIVQNNSSNLKN